MKMFAGAALFAAALAVPALASDEELTIVNRTGYDIAEIYISPSSAEDWQEDVLGSEYLVNGETLIVDMSQTVDTCDWDVMVVYVDTEVVYWRGLDFCELSRISLYYDAGSGNTWADTD